MANTLTDIMPKILARGLLALREQAIMPRLVNGDYSLEAAEKGDTIDVPIPSAASAVDVTPSHVQPAATDSAPTKVQIQLNKWKMVDFHLTDKQMLEIDRNRHFIPLQMSEAVRALANAINQSVMDEYKGIYGYVGTAGTTPFANTVNGATDLRKVLNEQLCPRSNRRAVLDFAAEANALALSQFADLEKTGDQGVKIEGNLGRKYGFDWFTDDIVPTHTAGTITTGLAAKSATAQALGDKTIVCTTAASTGACALKKGDIITFAGDTQTYVLTDDATQAAAASDVTLNIEPGLKKALAGGEAVTVKASHVVNLGFHRDAFALAMRPLAQSAADLELGNRLLTMQDPVTGLTLRLEVVRQFKQTSWQLDALWGVKLVRPALAARLAG